MPAPGAPVVLTPMDNTIISTGSIMEQAMHSTENTKTSG